MNEAQNNAMKTGDTVPRIHRHTTLSLLISFFIVPQSYKKNRLLATVAATYFQELCNFDYFVFFSERRKIS
jgi:hypothetical protein